MRTARGILRHPEMESSPVRSRERADRSDANPENQNPAHSKSNRFSHRAIFFIIAPFSLLFRNLLNLTSELPRP